MTLPDLAVRRPVAVLMLPAVVTPLVRRVPVFCSVAVAVPLLSV